MIVFTGKYSALILIAALFASCTASKKEQNTDWEKIYTEQGLERIDTLETGIKVGLRYSTTNNFVGKDVYGDLEDAYLQPEAAQKLYSAADLLQASNPEYSLLIYDAARPRRIQQILWDVVDIPIQERSKYVANPASGSIHNYGCAVDLTIIDGSGKELDMGTDYDDFSSLAHTDNEEKLITEGKLTREQHQNRLLLRDVMTRAGFLPLRSEWWHFDAFSREETKKRFKIVE